MTFSARQAMVVYASEEAARIIELSGAHVHLESPSGAGIGPSDLILSAEGQAGSLHRAWKTAQTLVEWASGIASATAAIVANAGGDSRCLYAQERSGNEGAVGEGGQVGRWPDASARAVRNAPGVSRAPTVSRRSAGPDDPASTSYTTGEENCRRSGRNGRGASLGRKRGADVLQLEKFTPDALAACITALAQRERLVRPLIAAAGGIRADNAAAYVAAGADLLVTSAPYAAPAKDVQVNFRSTT
jgi:molybdenum transport protein